MSTERDWVKDFTHENGNYQNICINCKQTFIGHKRRPVCRVCWRAVQADLSKTKSEPMSTDKFMPSDAGLAQLRAVIERRVVEMGDNPEDSMMVMFLRELQQRRETDRRIAWEAQRELWIQNAYDNNPLKQAISELLP